MTEGKGGLVRNCPAGFDVCYPSFHCQDCLFWRNDRCDYEAIIAGEESVAQPAIVSPELSKEERQEEAEGG